jgi:hypothetical protein
MGLNRVQSTSMEIPGGRVHERVCIAAEIVAVVGELEQRKENNLTDD